MKFAICDDIKADIETIRCCIGEVLAESGKDCELDGFESGEALLAAMQSGAGDYDLCFLDIFMENMNGMETATAIRELLPDCGLVFVTTSRDFSLDAFSLNALHYIVKPITREQIAEALRRYSCQLFRPHIEVFDGIDHIKVYLDSILYIESNRNNNAHSKTTIVTRKGKIPVRFSLAEAERLVGDGFLRLHRSLVVNMDFIKRMDTDRCVLKNGMEEVLSRLARREIREKYKNYLGGRVRDIKRNL